MRWKEMEVAGWGRALRSMTHVARPERMGAAQTAGAAAPAMGNRRSYGDAALNTGGKAVDLTRMDRVLAFDADTGLVTVEAGLTIGELCHLFAPKGWLPPVMPGTGFATIGGCIAMDVHGKNHHNLGSFGQHVTALTLAGPTGVQEIKPDAGPLWQATMGGLGRLDEWGGSSNPWRGTEIGKTRCASFEAWMMGYPMAWVSRMVSAMPLSRPSLKRSSKA